MSGMVVECSDGNVEHEHKEKIKIGLIGTNNDTVGRLYKRRFGIE